MVKVQCKNSKVGKHRYICNYKLEITVVFFCSLLFTFKEAAGGRPHQTRQQQEETFQNVQARGGTWVALRRSSGVFLLYPHLGSLFNFPESLLGGWQEKFQENVWTSVNEGLKAS